MRVRGRNIGWSAWFLVAVLLHTSTAAAQSEASSAPAPDSEAPERAEPVPPVAEVTPQADVKSVPVAAQPQPTTSTPSRSEWFTTPSLEAPPYDPNDPTTFRARLEGKPRFASVSVSFSHGSMWGSDFEGQTFLAGSSDDASVDVVLVPELSASTGFAVEACMGGMRSGFWGFWLCAAYSRRYMTGHFAGVEVGDAVANEVIVPIRVMFRAHDPFRPYAEASVGVGGFTLENAAAEADSDGNLVGAPGDADFSGLSLGVGVGAVFFVSHHFALDARIGYRAHTFVSVNDEDLAETLGAGSYELRIGPALYF